MNAFEHIDIVESRVYNEVNGVGFELYITPKNSLDNAPLLGTQASLAQTVNS